MTLAVILLKTSSMAIGRTSLNPFGNATRREADKRETASSGSEPGAIALHRK